MSYVVYENYSFKILLTPDLFNFYYLFGKPADAASFRISAGLSCCIRPSPASTWGISF
jgi:hypothetical protein